MNPVYDTLLTLVNRLDDSALSSTNVIPWSCPVPSFGNLAESEIATLGLNPSNREFVDVKGRELDGGLRRFHTLSSLDLCRWSDANEEHLSLIMESCSEYFLRNPYDGWFKRLDDLISGTKASYYGESVKACHLDLIPYATERKWTELTTGQRSMLMELAGDTLALLLRDSPIRLLILNGSTVVNSLQSISKKTFEKKEMGNWTLARKTGAHVKGYAFTGSVNELTGIKLKRDIKIIGFNHNIQSSFGVTRQVKSSIRDWITRADKGMM